jgi:hypothetical protein
MNLGRIGGVQADDFDIRYDQGLVEIPDEWTTLAAVQRRNIKYHIGFRRPNYCTGNHYVRTDRSTGECAPNAGILYYGAHNFIGRGCTRHTATYANPRDHLHTNDYTYTDRNNDTDRDDRAVTNTH